MQASSKNNVKSVLEKEGFYLLTVCNNSMLPLIRARIDTVEIRPVSAPLKTGDVILFRYNERYILHRLIEVKGNYLITRGDSCVQSETITTDNVVGIMTGLWRGEKQLPLTSLRYRTYVTLRLRHPFLFRVLKFLMKRNIL